MASSVEEHLLKENEALQAKVETLSERLKKFEWYESVFEGRVNRNAKDSVFLDLFSRAEYRLMLYRKLFPEDSDVTMDDVELFRVDSILTNHPYNDLGILVRDRLIVLAESQTSWSDNIIWRLDSYFFDTCELYMQRHNMRVHSDSRLPMPDVEAFVIYPGTRWHGGDTISLRDIYFSGDPTKPDFCATVIHGDVKDGILAECLGFCRTLDEHRPAYKNDPTPERWISVTIDVCLERGFLVSYVTEHRTEVQKIMLDMYDAEQVREFDRLMIECKAEIAFGRMAGMSESAIKDLLVRRHGFLEEYAQNLLDYEEDPNTVVLV